MVKEEIEVLDCGVDLTAVGPLSACCFAAFGPFK
jgi:hypothetical protein